VLSQLGHSEGAVATCLGFAATNAVRKQFFHQGSFCQNRLNLAFFLVSVLGPESALASVSAHDVRDVINVSSAEVPDAKVLKIIKRAEAPRTGESCGLELH
jgi:hypothetical protein